MFLILAAPIYILIKSVQGFPFFHSLTDICYVYLFYGNHSHRCEVISHYNFDLHFPDDE